MMTSFDQNEELASSKEFKARIASAIANGDLEDSLEEVGEFVRDVKMTTFQKQLVVVTESLQLQSVVKEADIDKLKQQAISLYGRAIGNFSLDQQRDVFEKGLNIIVRQTLYNIDHRLAESWQPQKFRRLNYKILS